MIVATIVGIWLGIFSAKHAGRWQDVLGTAFGLIGLSVPVFWLGLLAILFFLTPTRLVSRGRPDQHGWHRWFD